MSLGKGTLRGVEVVVVTVGKQQQHSSRWRVYGSLGMFEMVSERGRERRWR